VPHGENARNARKHTVSAPRAATPCERAATNSTIAHAPAHPSLAGETERREALNRLSLAVDRITREFQPAATKLCDEVVRRSYAMKLCDEGGAMKVARDDREKMYVGDEGGSRYELREGLWRPCFSRAGLS
jgi:hypothetical protein